MNRILLWVLGVMLVSSNAPVSAREMQFDHSDDNGYQRHEKSGWRREARSYDSGGHDYKIYSEEGRQDVRPYNLGDDVQRHLRERYDDVRVNCGRDTQPAFLCDGVLIRGTRFSTTYKSWDNSPASHASGGVSFSYLRKDSKFNKLAYGYVNGYIFLPFFYAGGKLTPEILCSYPVDAATEFRQNRGCGVDPAYPRGGPCQAQGVTTASAWFTHYRAGGNSHRSQRGFDVRDVLDAQATAAFDSTIKAMALIAAESFTEQNELRLHVWADGLGSQLPLEAFFYVSGSAQGRVDAQNDQRDFKNTTGLAIPVISVGLPVSSANNVTFTYIPGDQVVVLP